MDLTQQVKNHYATVNNNKRKAKAIDIGGHVQSLQELSNGSEVAYQDTLRVVSHDGSKAPRQIYKQNKKHPGYSRNDLGGMFTS